MKWTVESLQDFEKKLIKMFEGGEIRCPLHLSGGNESQLIDIFDHIKPNDFVLSTHRNHYHYLLKGGDPERLIEEIIGASTGVNRGLARSMNICDPSLNFYTSAIVGGNCALAVGIGMGLKKDQTTAAKGGARRGGTSAGLGTKGNHHGHAWCFVGDGGEDTGHFVEAVRFSQSRGLPVTFVVEDNDKSTDSSKKERWGNYKPLVASNILRYSYERIYPHVGIGKHVIF